MPSINRIRVNNVKYNFGTQQYDDFTMRMYGRNTLYDLANGGGKSILMLLLLQNLIPNCTLDEKQPIEKLFRNGGGNTTIHSLIEWKLDETDGKDGYRYMTTGFCARKAKDSPDEEEGGKEVASVEYFNYCIFYRNYNDNDIVNLPLVKDGERITFSGLKSYLKELSHRDMGMEIRVFERKGEYQRFIAQYGLYESHWEIVRGINKTEGHVRTYFETNYRTARKVVEDLLIEEIIEKAYLVKIDKNDGTDDMAHTLLDIKDKLVELSKKKREIADYDRQTELLHVLEARVAAFLELYENQNKQCENIANVCVTGATIAKNSEEKMRELEAQREEQLASMNDRQRKLESLKVKREQLKAEQLMEQIQILQEELDAEETNYNSCQRELNKKESMNDYLDYEKDKALKEEHEAIIEASMHQNEDQLTGLRGMAAEKKRRDDKELREFKAIAEQEKTSVAEAAEKVEFYTKTEREADVAFAVAAHDKQQMEVRYQKQVQDMQELRSHLTNASFLNPEEILESLEEQKKQQKEAIDALTEAIYQSQQEYYARKQEASLLEQQIDKQQKTLEELETNDREYQNQTDKLRRMLEIYNASDAPGADKSVEWLTNQDLTNLVQNINQRYLQNVVFISAKREQLEKGIKRLRQLKEGRLIAPTETLERVKYYIESRHGRTAIFGMDYLAAQSEETKEELMRHHPLLPYGLLVENFDGLDTDAKLRELKLGDGFVPIYNQSMLDVLSTDSENDCVMFLQRGSKAFIGKDAILEETKLQEEVIQELTTEIDRLEEMNTTYQEDSAFVLGLQGMAVLDAEKQKMELRDALRESRNAYSEITHQLKEAEQTIADSRTELEEKQQEYFTFLAEKGTLESIGRLSEQMSETEAEKQKADAEYHRLQTVKNRYQQELHQWRTTLSDSRNRLQSVQSQLQERLTDWEQLYKEYYVEGTMSEENLTKEKLTEGYSGLSDRELEARFKAEKAIFEKATVVLEDKKKLIETLQSSMERSRKAIQKRGFAIADLEAMRENHQLFAVSEADLEELSKEVSRVSVNVDRLHHDVESRKQQVTRLEGSIEQAIMTLEERFGPYVEQEVSAEEIGARIADGEEAMKRLNEDYKNSEKEYQQYSREYAAMIDLYKDVKRIVETNEISLQNARVQMVDKEQLRDIFETSLLSYDKSTKALERARNELQRYKNQTSQALHEMQAFEMAQTINDDVEVPKNFGEAKQLRDSLASIINVIALEKERIEQSIEDMEFIKSNFEKQCIQRCQDVKNELEKLPKLSRIMLDDEAIQMVGLNISYVKDEFIPKRMSDYIDGVVMGADRFENQNERIKFIRGKLELKRLFSVIVTDMNNIKLTLYKRERIREQSRYLRYEEAVGSTGQSQGIYIQFLVAIINYISGLYSPNAESDKLMKTIFIDNPFGAAKDVYIWEPIFAMLATNNVQLIVPARGATPAITARFDVNYILGQQMVGKRQQTVVIDYRSQVEQEEVEYRNLEYEQVSFDFI